MSRTPPIMTGGSIILDVFVGVVIGVRLKSWR